MEEPPTPTRPEDSKNQVGRMSVKGELRNSINAFLGENSRDEANQLTRYTCGEREGTGRGGLDDRGQKEDSARNVRGRPVPLGGSIGGSGRRRVTSINKDKKEPQTEYVWPFPTRKPGDDLGGAKSINNRREDDSAAGRREEADDLYSRQDTTLRPQDRGDNKEEGSSHIRPHDGPPVDNGRYETRPDMPEKEDKSNGINAGRGTEGEDMYSNPAPRAKATNIVGQGEAPCPETPPRRGATPSTEESKEKAQEETYNKRADTSRQAGHTNRDYPDIEMFQEGLEEERDQTERLSVQLRERIQDRRTSYHEGFAGIDQQTYRDLKDRDKRNQRERKGIRARLDWAMDILGTMHCWKVFF